MGLGSTLARVGGIVAPMIKMTGEHCSYLPSLIYGTAPILSGIAAVFLPETLNVPLPDTIDEVEGRITPERQSLTVQSQEPVLLQKLDQGRTLDGEIG